MKKLIEDEVIQKIEKICNEKNYIFNGFVNNKWIDTNTKLNLHCNKCNYIWNTTSYSEFIKHKNCPKCSGKAKITENEAIQKIEKICNEKNYIFNGFVNFWHGISTKLKLHCNKCNYSWETTIYESFIVRRGCPKCSGKAKITENEAIQKIEKICNEKNYIFNGFVDDKWNNVNTKLKLYCNKCNFDWKTTSYASIINGIGCPSCVGLIKLTEEEAILNIKKICNEKNYIFNGFVDDKWNNVKKTKIKLHCNKCDFDWKTTSYASIINGTGCPSCAGNLQKKYLSKEEFEQFLIANFSDVHSDDMDKAYRIFWNKNKPNNLPKYPRPYYKLFYNQ